MWALPLENLLFFMTPFHLRKPIPEEIRLKKISAKKFLGNFD